MNKNVAPRKYEIKEAIAELTEETKNMIGAKELALMKKSAYLVNVARAPIVNKEALYTAQVELHLMYFGKSHLSPMINY